jgi:N-methylhydantoinase B
MSAIDPITLEVMRNAFQSVAEEMGAALIRTALSPNIKDRRDCSTGVYSAAGELIAQAEHIPLHLGLMPSVVKSTLQIFPVGSLQPGDAIITNDPYISGSHLPDICILSPLFHDGACLGILANLAHHVDIGGIAPGGMPTISTEIFQEGLRIPPIRIRKAGVVDEEIMALITHNVRTSREAKGDFQAQLAANNVGERRLHEIIQKYGAEQTTRYMEELINYSERRMRARLRELPQGVFAFEDYLEGDGISDGLLTIKVSLSIEPTRIVVDFSGSSPQTKGSVNCTRPVTLACTFYALKAAIDPDLPSTGGAFRPIEVITPLGSIVNPLSGTGFQREHQHISEDSGCCSRSTFQGHARASAGGFKRKHVSIYDRRDQSAQRFLLLVRGNLWRWAGGRFQSGRNGRCAHEYDQHPQHSG